MELRGQILENRPRAQELDEQMQQIEAAIIIKWLDPTYNLARISVKRRTANRWSSGGLYIGGRWTCSATFFLACLAALELEGVILEVI